MFMWAFLSVIKSTHCIGAVQTLVLTELVSEHRCWSFHRTLSSWALSGSGAEAWERSWQVLQDHDMYLKIMTSMCSLWQGLEDHDMFVLESRLSSCGCPGWWCLSWFGESPNWESQGLNIQNEDLPRNSRDSFSDITLTECSRFFKCIWSLDLFVVLIMNSKF